MIKSMTGYGCANGVSGKTAITVELRSVNNRFFDCNIRLPRVYTEVEDRLKAIIQKRVSRGKVDVYVTIDASAEDAVQIRVNEPLAKAYMEAFKKIAEDCDLPNDLTVGGLVRFPDILMQEKCEDNKETLMDDICTVLSQALDGFCLMRDKEGKRLYTDIQGNLDNLQTLGEKAKERSPKTVAEYRQRLEARMSEVLADTNISQERILTEAAIFADRVAINEELVRLSSHIAQFRGFLEQDGPVGKKMDFLVQELNREVNTMGSKGNDLEMSGLVVDMKAEIEKIREQIQNVE